ncbi:hypothetical protein F4859DRAFT_489761 [Xylaria cf. heliscus]|nr:hypothetical protein F4859DRAFT_489761 [Xylaria cf. heliscus]
MSRMTWYIILLYGILISASMPALISRTLVSQALGICLSASFLVAGKLVSHRSTQYGIPRKQPSDLVSIGNVCLPLHYCNLTRIVQYMYHAWEALKLEPQAFIHVSVAMVFFQVIYTIVIQ